MTTPMELTGIHHLTAVSAQIRDNYRFYTQTLGMRLVKRSVNQDDVSAYHLFYADAQGNPGTDLTFFDWPVGRERRGTRAITRTHLRVAGADALEWWAAHLREIGVTAGEITERDGRLVLDLEDPEGQRLALIDDGGQGEAHPWDRSPVPRRASSARPGADRSERAQSEAHAHDPGERAEHAPGASVCASRQPQGHGPRI